MTRLVIAALLSSLAAQAHEIGTSRVYVVLHAGQNYDVEIVTDATALAEKLGGKDGAQAAQLQALLVGADKQFRQRIQLAFDGVPMHPAITYNVAPAIDESSAAAATIHLTGPIPPKAQNLTWKFGWTFASYALTVRGEASANPTTQWLEGTETSKPFSVTALAPEFNRWQTAWRYLTLGFTHIMPNGLDHMLFVLGIYLLSNRAKTVLWQVSAFTVAHSITLGLSMYGLVSVSPRIVEPMIALSIAYVAIENIFLSELKSWRVALVFAFGLLHGFYLCINHAWRFLGPKKSVGTHGSRIGSAASVAITFFAVAMAQVFFRANSIEDAYAVIRAAFPGTRPPPFLLLYASPSGVTQ